MLSGYAKSGMTNPARKLFNKMPKRCCFLEYYGYWVGQSRFFGEGLRFYKELRRLGIGYNEYSFAGLLSVYVKF